MAVVVKRVYEAPSSSDGVRVLVDRLWPRGLTKEKAALKFWLRDLAPSNELRQWFHAHPEAWSMFRKRYFKELASEEASAAVETTCIVSRKASGASRCSTPRVTWNTTTRQC